MLRSKDFVFVGTGILLCEKINTGKMPCYTQTFFGKVSVFVFMFLN